MKLHVIMTMAALMFMAPAIFAKDTATPPAPTGPNAKGLETTQPSKEMVKADTPKKEHKKKKKHTKPLTPAEQKDMQNRLDTTMPPEGGPMEEGVK